MAGSYDIKKVHTTEDFALLRVPEIEIEGTTIDSLSRAVNKKLPQSFLRNSYQKTVGKSFYEAFMRLDLMTLRGIDSDDDKRQAFIDARLPPNIAASNAVNGQLIPIIILVLEINVGDTLLNSDIDYLNDILTWVSNKIYVTPILRFADEISRQDRIKFYKDFVARLLESKKSLSDKIRASASIPGFYQRTKVDEVLSMYDGENKPPSLVVLDFERSRITSSKMIGATNRIRRFFSNEEGKEPKYAIYGFNVKPYKKGEETPDAEDLGCYISGLSTIGDNYKLTNSAGMFPPPPKTLAELPRVFSSDSYKYVRLNADNVIGDFNSWYEANTEKKIEAPYPKYVPYTYRYNVHKTSEELTTVSNMVKKGELEELKKRISSKDITKTLKGKTF